MFHSHPASKKMSQTAEEMRELTSEAPLTGKLNLRRLHTLDECVSKKNQEYNEVLGKIRGDAKLGGTEIEFESLKDETIYCLKYAGFEVRGDTRGYECTTYTKNEYSGSPSVGCYVTRKGRISW